jgi:uncharacterized protein
MKDKLSVINTEEPWYKEGLRFKCTECGGCCTGSPGYIWINEEEIQALANHLKMNLDDFAKKYLRKIGHRFSLNERPHTYDCVFLKNKKCTIYGFRPKQCRTFPWWTQNLKSRQDWIEAAKFCEGIDNTAPIMPFEEIQKQLHQM